MVRHIDPLQVLYIGKNPRFDVAELSRRIRELTAEHKVEVIVPRAPEPTPTIDITPAVARRLHNEVDRIFRRTRKR